MVTAFSSSPSLLIGWYGLIASFNTSSWRSLVLRGYSRRCWHGIACSRTLKQDEDVVSVVSEQYLRSKENKMEVVGLQKLEICVTTHTSI